MDYQVRKLKNQGVFDVYVARDEKSEFMYWGKNTTQNVNQVAVVFDKKNANIQLNEGMMVLSLDKITNLHNGYLHFVHKMVYSNAIGHLPLKRQRSGIL